MVESNAILEIEGVRVEYRRRGRKTRAVRGVSLNVGQGETLGLIGESGCGKSSLAKAILGLVPAAFDEALFLGRSIKALSQRQWRPLRKEAQMIFQDVGASLSPRMRVEALVAEPLIVHGLVKGRGARRRKVAGIIESVGLDEGLMRRFPHELSGGQRQRVGIARALATSPCLLIADEPVSSLDISIQAQVLELLQKEQKRRKLSMIFISHDIRAVRALADRVMVMYAGHLVEEGSVAQVLGARSHPYTRLLCDSLLSTRMDKRKISDISDAGEPDGIPAEDAACPFLARCPKSALSCAAELPAWREKASGHLVRCLDPD